MIEVKVVYTRKTYQSGRELFIYKDLLVKGHSSDGTPNSIKCCAGVTAVTCGLLNLLEGEGKYCTIEVRKGYFHFVKGSAYSDEINYAINGLVYQLDFIQLTYPQFFKTTYIEEKETDGKQNH